MMFSTVTRADVLFATENKCLVATTHLLGEQLLKFVRFHHLQLPGTSEQNMFSRFVRSSTTVSFLYVIIIMSVFLERLSV